MLIDKFLQLGMVVGRNLCKGQELHIIRFFYRIFIFQDLKQRIIHMMNLGYRFYKRIPKHHLDFLLHNLLQLHS